MPDSVDFLVQSFLKECRRERVSALVAYGLTVHDKPVLRIAANTEEAAAQGLWNWLTKLDERAIESAAKALAFATRGQRHLESLDDRNAEDPEAYWPFLSEEWRVHFRVLAQAAISAAKNQQGRTLNIVGVDGKVPPA